MCVCVCVCVCVGGGGGDGGTTRSKTEWGDFLLGQVESTCDSQKFKGPSKESLYGRSQLPLRSD